MKRLFYACDDVTIRLGRPAGKPPTPLQNHSANHSALFRESPKSQPSSTPNSALRPKRKRSRTRNHKHAHIKTVGPKKQELLRESVTLSTATTGIVTRTRDPKPRPNETKRDSEMKLIVKRRVQPRSDPTTGNEKRPTVVLLNGDRPADHLASPPRSTRYRSNPRHTAAASTSEQIPSLPKRVQPRSDPTTGNENRSLKWGPPNGPSW